MNYIVETRFDDDGDWYAVIDPDKSKVKPVTRMFSSEDSATKWAVDNLDKVSDSNWRVTQIVED